MPARQKIAFSCLVLMHMHEVVARNTVAIGKNQVITTGKYDCFVQDDAFLAAIILVPDMFDIELR